MPIAFYKLDVINALIIDAHKLFLLFIDNKLLINAESEVNTMLVPLSIVLVFAYVVSIALIFKPLDILQQIIQKIYIKRLALIGFLLICLSQIIKYRSTGVGFSDVDFARNLITQSIKQPLGFYLLHFSYFGVAFILPFLYWAPRLIDLGLIKVLNETVADADMTIDGKCPSELNHGRSYAAIASGFTARVSSQVNRIRL